MTEKQFDKYPFSINTKVCVFEDKQGKVWDNITEVDFEDRYIGTDRGNYVHYSNIIDIIEVSAT
jgi:hypothetical protein